MVKKSQSLSNGGEIEDVLNGLQEDLNKAFGDDSAMRLDAQDTLSRVDHWVSSRSIVIDSVLRGGRPMGSSLVPFGRQMEISGVENCLDSCMKINYHVWLHGKKQDNKGGTVERLYQRFNRIRHVSGKGKWIRKLSTKAKFTASCMNEEGRIFHNEIVDVVNCGIKPCFELKTKRGFCITSTANHKFWTGEKFVSLGELCIGDKVMIHNNTPYKSVKCKVKNYRSYLNLKYHPIAGLHIARIIHNRTTKEKRDYHYFRILRSRAVIEAKMNDLTLNEYINRLNLGKNYISGMKFLSKKECVHHIDENILNDDLSNLIVLTIPEHQRLHSYKDHNNLRFTVIPDKILSITYVGMRQTYDIKMRSPFNNFIANKFVVHNSGKTTLCAQIAAEVQSKGGIVVVTDTEERIAHDYWKALGVDISRIIRIHANSLKEVFNKQYRALQFAREHAKDRLILLIWDSLGGTSGTPVVEEDAEIDPMTQAEKFAMRRAAIISQGIELINGIITQTRACYLYTNHEYTKIGVTWGSNRETRGGGKPKYFATVRIQLTPVGVVKEADVSGDEQIIGQRIKVKALKNSMAGVLMSREAVLMSGKGFVNEYAVLSGAVRLGLITQNKAWYSWTNPKDPSEEIKFQGFEGFCSKIMTHSEYPSLINEVINYIG